MAKKGGSRSLKRLAAPKAWRLPKKEKVWAAKPLPGPHALDSSLPLVGALKLLEKAATTREARKLVKAGEVQVDAKTRRESRFAVGFMDVLSFPATKEAFRVMLDGKGKIAFRPEKAAGFKLCRVERKTTLRGGATQLSLHDGRTLLVKDERKTRPGDVLKISLPDQKVLESFSLAEGSPVCLVRGKYAGRTGRVTRLEKTGGQPAIVRVEADGESFTTLASYAFVIGGDKPEVAV